MNKCSAAMEIEPVSMTLTNASKAARFISVPKHQVVFNCCF
jgi:hypothetical protein